MRRIYDHLTQRDRILGSRLRARDVGARPRARVRRRGVRGRPRASSASWRQDYRDAGARRTVITGSATFARRSRRSTRARARPGRAAPGFGLLGVSTAGDVALCHRFAGSDDHRLGTVRDGIDRDAQRAFLESHHVAHKTDCATCWARPLCAGGCYHEAHTRHGTTQRPNLHYCDWIRGWTDTCLPIYGEIAQAQPGVSAPVRGRRPMKHLSPVNEKAQAPRAPRRVAGRRARTPRCRRAERKADVVALDARCRSSRPGPHIPLGCSTVFCARLGSRSHRRHGGTLPAGRTRSLRLPSRLFLARAGARPAESRAGLDEEVRRRPEGLAEDRSHLPVRRS